MARSQVPAYRHLDTQILRDLYLVEGLSLGQIAKRLGPPASKRVVQRALQADGVQLLPSTPPARKQEQLSRELLERLYIDEGRGMEEIRQMLGLSMATVRNRMIRLGIDRIPGKKYWVGTREPLTRARLEDLRSQGLSPTAIGRRLGYSTQQVHSALERHGMSPVDTGRPSGDGRQRLGPADELGLGELYWLRHHEGMPLAEIARALGTDHRRISQRFKELDIDVGTHPRRLSDSERPETVPAPDLALIQRVFARAAGKARQTPRNPLAGVQAEELRGLHHDQAMGLYELARHYGVGLEAIRSRLQALGIEVRRPPKGHYDPRGKQPTRLASLYARANVTETIDRLGIPRRLDGETINPSLFLTREILEALHMDLGLSVEEVAAVTDRPRSSVSRALRDRGLEQQRRLPRPASGPKLPTSGRLDTTPITTMAAGGATAEEIARATGLPTPTTVRIVAQILEVPLAGQPGPPPLPEEVLAHIRALGVDPGHAAAVLDPRHLGVGAARYVAHWPWPPQPVLLAHLYHGLGLIIGEIADRLHLSPRTLKALIVDAGIRLKTEEELRPLPRHRWRLDPEELTRRYVDHGEPIAAIAAEIGISVGVVYREMHRFHLPVQPPHSDGAAEVRYDRLIANPEILAALAAAGIEPAGINPPVRTRSLPPNLMRTLLVDQGLSPFDIELLTGRLDPVLREDARRCGIERRDRGQWVAREVPGPHPGSH